MAEEFLGSTELGIPAAFEHAKHMSHAHDLLKEMHRALDNIVDRATPQQYFSPAEMARKLSREKAARDRFFPKSFTKDPAWPILLELYRCRNDYEETSVTSLSFGACIPLSTGHRWIDGLRRGGYAEVFPSKSDGRSSLIIMTDKGFDRMNEYLLSVCRPI